MTSEELEHQDGNAQDLPLNSDVAADKTQLEIEEEPKVEAADTEPATSDPEAGSDSESNPSTEGDAEGESESDALVEDADDTKTSESDETASENENAEGGEDSEDGEEPKGSNDADESESSEEASEPDEAEDAKGSEDTEQKDDDDQPKRKGRGKKALLIIMAILLVIIAGCCIFLAIDDSKRTQVVPKSTTLDGQVDVTGMTRDELAELLDSRAQGGVASVAALDINGSAYDIDLLEVGKLDTEATVKQAFAPYDAFFLARWATRVMEYVTGNTSNYDIYTAFDIDHNALVTRVEEIADTANTDPKDAGYEFNSDTRALDPTAPKDGIELNVDATVAAIEKTIEAPSDTSSSRFVVEGIATITTPDVLEPGQAILVDTRKCRVYLYEAGEEVASYACTPGQSGYSTPRGDWYLDYKDAAPTWINPHSDWSQDMPETIGPGATNPLGLRALAVSCGGGIYIHGTTNTGGLGAPGSHGCVRLSNSNIVELYDRVSAGIPIIIR